MSREKDYTPEQEAMAARIAKAMSKVPKDRLPLLETVVESVLIGAGIAMMDGVAERTGA